MACDDSCPKNRLIGMNRLFHFDTNLSELSMMTQFELFVSPSGGIEVGYFVLGASPAKLLLLLLLYSSPITGWSYAQPRLWSVGHGMRDAENEKKKKKEKRSAENK